MEEKPSCVVIGASSGAQALALKLTELGHIPCLCDESDGSLFARWPRLDELYASKRYDDIATLRKDTPGPLRLFVFSAYEGYVKDLSLLTEILTPGDIIHECNAFPYHSLEQIESLVKARTIVWTPLKIAFSVESGGGLSLITSGRGLDSESRDFLYALAHRRLDTRVCFAQLPEPGLIAACRAAYRGLLDTLLQGFADAFYVMSSIYNLSPFEARMVFADWAKTELDSPVLQAMRNILASMDEGGESSLSRILDTVKFDSSDIEALNLAVAFRMPPPLSTAALSARIIAALRDERVGASVSLSGVKQSPPRSRDTLPDLRDALILAIALAYAQSLSSLQSAITRGGGGSSADVALAWAGSSLLQGPLMDQAAIILSGQGLHRSLFFEPSFQIILNRCQSGLRRTVTAIAECGIPSSIFSSALTMYDSLRYDNLSSNLVSAGLDYFFGIGFERVDRPRGERYHLDWSGDGGITRIPS